jgi:hypothetical protein
MANFSLSLGNERAADEPGTADERKEAADDDDDEKAQDELCPQRKLKRFHVACFRLAFSKKGTWSQRKESSSLALYYTKKSLLPLAEEGTQSGFLLRLSLELPEELALMVADIDGQGHVSRQGMRAAGVAWVVRPKRDLNHVQEPLGDLAALDERFGGLFDGHIDGGSVVNRRDDEVGFCDYSVLIRFIMVDEGSSRSFDNAHSFGWNFRGDIPDIGVRNGFVFEQRDHTFCSLERFDQTGPVESQGVVDRLSS